MPDIFISYRHEPPDEWVGHAIEAKLEALGYDTFFDCEDIALGADFETTIDEALENCRVVLVVVSGNWQQPAHVARLHREDDWVRREIAAALARRITVVPLLVDCDRLPPADQFPDDLKPFATKQGWQITAATLDDTYLHARLQQLLREGPRKPALLLRALPFLCDRGDQEEAFVSLVPSGTRPAAMLACVVHGHAWEAHDELLERFESEGVIDEALQCSGEGVSKVQLQLSRARLKERQIAEALRSALKSGLLPKRASDADLQTSLAKLPQPLIAVAQLTWSDYQEVGGVLVKELIEAWQALAVREDGSPVRLPFDALLWINLSYDDEEAALSSDVLLKPLPKLPAIAEGDIREWVNLDKVKDHVRHKKEQLLALTKGSRCHRPGQLHMTFFADEFNKIMSLR